MEPCLDLIKLADHGEATLKHLKEELNRIYHSPNPELTEAVLCLIDDLSSVVETFYDIVEDGQDDETDSEDGEWNVESAGQQPKSILKQSKSQPKQQSEPSIPNDSNLDGESAPKKRKRAPKQPKEPKEPKAEKPRLPKTKSEHVPVEGKRRKSKSMTDVSLLAEIPPLTRPVATLDGDQLIIPTVINLAPTPVARVNPDETISNANELPITML